MGHAEAISTVLDAGSANRLHHAWLFCGPEGIGKALAATAIAKRLLSDAGGPAIAQPGLDVPADHPIGRLINAFTHPDFALVERLPKDMKQVRDLSRNDWPENVERARNITIDQIRALGRMFTLRPTYSARRVIIIDAIDDLERGAANAVLKNLEEPPAGTVFFLISHAPKKLLPTIWSRCRVLQFRPLQDDAIRSLVKTRHPSLSAEELKALVSIGNGSPAKAFSFAALDVSAIDAALSTLAKSGDLDNHVRMELATMLSGKAMQPRYEYFLARVPSFIAQEARQRGGAALASALSAWDAAITLSETAIRQSLDPHMTVFELGSVVAGLAPKGTSAKA